MSAETDKVRARHRNASPGFFDVCVCGRDFPCDATMLADQLDAVEAAIRELHVPTHAPGESVYGPNDAPQCSECTRCGMYEWEPIPYPCPTIEALDKALT